MVNMPITGLRNVLHILQMASLHMHISQMLMVLYNI